MSANLTILKVYKERKRLLRLSPEAHYEKYLGLIKTFIKRNYRRDTYYELLSTANEAYTRALHSYDPQKGEFSTHLYHTLRGAFRSHKNFQNQQYMDYYESSSNDNPLDNLVLKETLKSLSFEAQQVVDVALNTPTELIELAQDVYNNYHVTMNIIRKYLVKKKWKHVTINNAIREIRTALWKS